MPATRSESLDNRTLTPATTPKWVDLDPQIRNSDQLVAVFSQRRWDGGITFSIHREFERYNHELGEIEVSKTAFVPEALAHSYLAIAQLAIGHLEKLKAERAAGKLPFPEGGSGSPRHR